MDSAGGHVTWDEMSADPTSGVILLLGGAVPPSNEGLRGWLSPIGRDGGQGRVGNTQVPLFRAVCLFLNSIVCEHAASVWRHKVDGDG